MRILIEWMFIFACAATIGWGMEVVFRSVRAKRFVNPGFLSGCCLPLYGVGGLALSLICLPAKQIASLPLRLLLLFFGGGFVMTVIELIGGLIALSCFHMRLWDYSNQPCNYKGLICLKFSVCWGVCCVVFDLLIDPWLRAAAVSAGESVAMVLAIGIYFGLFLADLAESMHLAGAVKRCAKEMKQVLNLEYLKAHARDRLKSMQRHPSRVLFLQNASIGEYLTAWKKETQTRAEEWKKKVEQKLRKK